MRKWLRLIRFPTIASDDEDNSISFIYFFVSSGENHRAFKGPKGAGRPRTSGGSRRLQEGEQGSQGESQQPADRINRKGGSPDHMARIFDRAFISQHSAMSRVCTFSPASSILRSMHLLWRLLASKRTRSSSPWRSPSSRKRRSAVSWRRSYRRWVCVSWPDNIPFIHFWLKSLSCCIAWAAPGAVSGTSPWM